MVFINILQFRRGFAFSDTIRIHFNLESLAQCLSNLENWLEWAYSSWRHRNDHLNLWIPLVKKTCGSFDYFTKCSEVLSVLESIELLTKCRSLGVKCRVTKFVMPQKGAANSVIIKGVAALP